MQTDTAGRTRAESPKATSRSGGWVPARHVMGEWWTRVGSHARHHRACRRSRCQAG
ncbi:MAG: hypothetical protein MZV70_19745 [Desulfobacterales bacterium]|nr:hypothetical protein [Desulfobacterales bacterium]